MAIPVCYKYFLNFSACFFFFVASSIPQTKIIFTQSGQSYQLTGSGCFGGDFGSYFFYSFTVSTFLGSSFFPSFFQSFLGYYFFPSFFQSFFGLSGFFGFLGSSFFGYYFLGYSFFGSYFFPLGSSFFGYYFFAFLGSSFLGYGDFLSSSFLGDYFLGSSFLGYYFLGGGGGLGAGVAAGLGGISVLLFNNNDQQAFNQMRSYIYSFQLLQERLTLFNCAQFGKE